MQPLYKRELYSETIALQIETLGATAVSIANRWAMSWEQTVLSLLVRGQYLAQLQKQTDLEKDILAQETDLSHLSSTEILAMHSVSMAPPQAI